MVAEDGNGCFRCMWRDEGCGGCFADVATKSFCDENNVESERERYSISSSEPYLFNNKKL